MIKFNNLNNLDEYLKKTDAENIYMKKINSMQVSFTTLLTSITNRFHDYDVSISNLEINTGILSNNYNNLSSSITNLNNTVNLLSSNQSSMSTLIGSLSSNLNSVSSSLTLLQSNFSSYTSNNDNVINNLSLSLNNNYNSLSSSLTNLSNSFTTFQTSINQEISNIWSAMSGGGNNNYNFFKEFGKETQLLYRNMDNYHMCIDNEEFEFLSNKLSSYTMVNPNKLEYVFCSNVLSSTANNGVNLGGDYSRLGLKLPGKSNATSFDDSIAQNWITATVSSVYLFQHYGWSNFNSQNYIKCLKAYLCNDAMYNDFNYISTNLNAETIDMMNYIRDNATNLYSTFWLNDRVKMISGFSSNQGIHMDIRRHSNSLGMNTLTITGYQQSLGCSIRGPIENGWCLGPMELPYSPLLYMYRPEDMRFTASSLTLYLRSDYYSGYTVTYNENMDVQKSLRMYINNNVFLQLPQNGITKDGLYVSFSNSNPNNTYNLNQWNINKIELYNAGLVNCNGNTLNLFTISNDSNIALNDLTFANNDITYMMMSASMPNVVRLNGNQVSVLTMSILNSDVGVSFGQNFRNLEMNLMCSLPNTFYSYNNPDATITCPQGKQKLEYFTAGQASFRAAPGIDVAVFSTLNINAMNGLAPYLNGGWKYVWCNQLNITNADIFYNSMLQQNSAMYHCPFFQLGSTYNGNDLLNQAINQGNSILSHELVLVDNAPTTSVNLRLTGNNTSESVNARFIEDQQYICKVDIRGWHPTRIIGFDQNYIFNNVASGYSAVSDQKFTAIVDNTADWNNYKMFFNPFGTPDENRIVLSTS